MSTSPTASVSERTKPSFVKFINGFRASVIIRKFRKIKDRYEVDVIFKHLKTDKKLRSRRAAPADLTKKQVIRWIKGKLPEILDHVIAKEANKRDIQKLIPVNTEPKNIEQKRETKLIAETPYKIVNVKDGIIYVEKLVINRHTISKDHPDYNMYLEELYKKMKK